MNYEFKKLGEVEALSEVPENATVLAEVDGSIKRVPSNGLGGGSGNTLVITSSDFVDAVSGISTFIAVPTTTYTANMTFDEAFAAFYEGKIDNIIIYDIDPEHGAPGRFVAIGLIDASSQFSVSCLGIITGTGQLLFWTEDGISIDPPLSNEK